MVRRWGGGGRENEKKGGGGGGGEREREIDGYSRNRVMRIVITKIIC